MSKNSYTITINRCRNGKVRVGVSVPKGGIAYFDVEALSAFLSILGGADQAKEAMAKLAAIDQTPVRVNAIPG